MTTNRYPKPGDRVAFVCGPGEFPRVGMCDRTGTVLTVTADRWYSHNAMILTDDGMIETHVGEYAKVGIGMYPLKERIALPLSDFQ